MKLTKVRRKLASMDVEFDYQEHGEGRASMVVGEIYFEDLDGSRYSVVEHTGNGGWTVQGILTFGKDFKSSWLNQRSVVEWLEEHKNRFVKGESTL